MSNKKLNNLQSLSKLSQSAAKNRDAVSDTVVLISPNDCYVQGNPRTEFNDALIEQLAREFVDPKIGQKEAIHVYPKDQNGKHRIHHGGTRYLASKQAIKQKPDFRLRAIVDHSLVNNDELDNYWDQGSNNILRDNMSLRDRAEFIGTFMDLAKANGRAVTQTDIAQRLGFKNSSMVSRLLKLRGMTPELADVYESGKTEDVEALATLAEIQKENPELFRQLVEETDLDRSTIRKAKKAGSLAAVLAPANVVKIENDDVAPSEQNAVFAHAQNLAGNEDLAGEGESYIIPFVDYLFKTGRVNLVIYKNENRYTGALETIFDHGINENASVNGLPSWAAEDEAIVFAKSLISAWAEKVAAAKDELKVEEVQDVNGYLNFIKPAHERNKESEQPETSPSAASTPAPAKKKNPVRQLTLFGTVKGEECILVTQVSNEVMAEKGDTAGFVYVQVGGEIKIAKVEDFVITGAAYRS